MPGAPPGVIRIHPVRILAFGIEDRGPDTRTVTRGRRSRDDCVSGFVRTLHPAADRNTPFARLAAGPRLLVAPGMLRGVTQDAAGLGDAQQRLVLAQLAVDLHARKDLGHQRRWSAAIAP